MESSELSDEEIALHYSWPTTRSYRLNMVLGADDHSVGNDSTSNTLTSPEDRRVLRIIRAHADVVIVGAESVRAEGWFLPTNGRLAVLSTSGNIPWETCPDRARVNVFPSVSSVIHSLKSKEINILCEGGITTAKLIHQHIGFDEIALTRIGVQAQQKLPAFLNPTDNIELVNTLQDEKNSMTFQFWRRAVEPQ